MGINLSKLYQNSKKQDNLAEKAMYVMGKKPEMKREINKIVGSMKRILSELEDLKKEVDKL